VEVVATPPDTLAPLTLIATFPGRLLTSRGAAGPFLLGDPSLAADGRGYIYTSDTLSYRVEVHDLYGQRRRVVARTVPTRQIPGDFAAQVREGVMMTFAEGIEGIVQSGMNAQRMQEVDRIVAGSIPPHAPPHFRFIDRILVTPEGTLWVERADRHPRPAMRAVAHAFGYVHWAWHPSWRAPQVFDVFDPDGRYQGTTEVPFEVRVLAVSADRLYGVEFDEFGVERVVILRLGNP
jgi:hypothetical protein